MRRYLACAFVFVALAVLCCPSGYAQQLKGRALVRVIVTDQSGAVVPHTEVKIVSSLPLGEPPQKLETNEAGQLYVNLEPGEYDISVPWPGPGFKPATRHILAQSATAQSLTIPLETGGCVAYCGEDQDSLGAPSGPVAALQPVELVPPKELPKSCSQKDVAQYGRPVLFAARNGLVYGVSAPRDHLKQNEDARIYIWLSNESTSAAYENPCCGITFLRGIQLIDPYGRHLETREEILERKALQQGHSLGFVCTCSGPFMTYPPGFCGVVDKGSLDQAYDLPPGRYIIEQRRIQDPYPYKTPPRTDTQGKVTGLAIAIEEP